MTGAARRGHADGRHAADQAIQTMIVLVVAPNIVSGLIVLDKGSEISILAAALAEQMAEPSTTFACSRLVKQLMILIATTLPTKPL
jgi:hypothetical protein